MNKNRIPKLAILHDIVGIGRCCIGASLPAIANMKVQPIPIVTAILSSHFGWSGKIYMEDLTDFIEGSLQHYDELDYQFDGIYTGFLTSVKQMEIAEKFLDRTKSGLKLVDPVMAEGGRIYPSYNDEMIARMRALLKHADIITPNQTEACFLAEMDYEQVLSQEQVHAIIEKLSQLSQNTVIVTGVKTHGGVFIFYKEKNNKDIHKSEVEYIDANYPGTGDLFAGILSAAMLRGAVLEQAIKYASQFISYTIRATFETGDDYNEGLHLENHLSWFFENPLPL